MRSAANPPRVACASSRRSCVAGGALQAPRGLLRTAHACCHGRRLQLRFCAPAWGARGASPLVVAIDAPRGAPLPLPAAQPGGTRSRRLRRARPAAAPARAADKQATRSDNLTPGAARLLLLLVPLCWGTYNPSLRFLYSQPHAPAPGELSATRLALALLPFVPTLGAIAAGAASQRAPPLAAPPSRPRRTAAASSSAPPAVQEDADATDWRAVVSAAAELGTYNFVGTACQAWGLAHTSAVHAGVLLSSINVFVPLGAALSGDVVRPVTWAACAMVLAGIGVLNSDGSVRELLGGDAELSLALSAGDVAVLLAAVSYSTYTVRLGAYARALPALPLSAGKTAALAAGCAAWAVAEAAGGWARPFGTGSVLWGGEGEPLSLRAATWAAVAYSALIPGSAATWLQARGQSGVSAAEAQVILALTPVVSVLIAGAFLGEEVGPNVWEGGAIMVAASLMCVGADVYRDLKAQREGRDA